MVFGVKEAIHTDVASRLELIRNHLGLKQSELCAQSGVSLRTYSYYSSGDRLPSPELMEWMAKNGINISWLLTGQGDMFLSSPTNTDQYQSASDGPAAAPEFSTYDLALIRLIIDMLEDHLKKERMELQRGDFGKVTEAMYKIVKRKMAEQPAPSKPAQERVIRDVWRDLREVF